VFPVRYELNPYIQLRRNSVFKGLSNIIRDGTWTIYEGREEVDVITGTEGLCI
jgi:hypothetical protein